MAYQMQLLDHLTEYRKSTLGLMHPGVYRHRGRDILKPHILSVENSWLNILEPTREMVQKYCDAHPAVKRHRYFHHLNSSQAFAFNLFFPYFAGPPEAAATLLRALGQTTTLSSWEPEAIPERHEGTNLDAIWVTADGVATFCEVKLSERDFGKASHDAKHLWKLQNTYAPDLKEHLDPEMLRPASFFKSYQILRNVWHLVRTQNSRLVFLLPRANTALWALLDATLQRIKPETRSHIRAIATEDVIAGLCRDEVCARSLRDYAGHLRRKYVLSLS